MKEHNNIYTNKMVNNPDHYIGKNGLEVFQILEEFGYDKHGMEAVLWGQIIQYLLRYSKKNGLEDLEKANYLLTRLIEGVSYGGKENV